MFFEDYLLHPKKRPKVHNNQSHHLIAMTEKAFLRTSIVNRDFNYDDWILRPDATEVASFLESPYDFCPKEEFINNTFVEVSQSFNSFSSFVLPSFFRFFLLCFRRKKAS
jgi:hypothetical protein